MSAARTPGRRIGRWLARTLLALIGLALVALLILHTSWGQEKLRARVESRLGERVATRAQLGGLAFSFGSGLSLERLQIDGTDQKPAVTVGRIHVVPSWGRLVHGDLVLAVLEVDDVKVDLHGKEDGTTNLTGAFRSGKPLERIGIERLAVHGVQVTLDKPDGTKLHVSGVTLDGALRAEPPRRTVHADLQLALAELGLQKPGLVLTGKTLSTHAIADLTDGSGPITIGPTRGELALEREGHAPYPFTLSLTALQASLAPGDLAIAADAVSLAALSIAAAKIETHRDGERLAGPQRAHVERLVVSAEAVNRLAEKPVLAGDVSVGLSLEGPPEAVAVKLDVTTPGGALGLEGHANTAASPPSYDLHLATQGLDLRKIVALETVPQIQLGKTSVHVQGSGIGKESANLGFELHVEDTTLQKPDAKEPIRIERADLSGRLEAGALDLQKLEIVAMGQTVTADAKYHLVQHDVDAHVATKGSLASTLAKLRAAGVKVPSSPIVSSVSVSGPLALHVHGNTDRTLTVTTERAALGVLGGGARAEGRIELVAGDPAKGEKRFRLAAMHADVDVAGVSLDTLGRLRGKPLPVSGTASAKIRVEGSPAAPEADFDVTVKVADDMGEAHLRGTLHGGVLHAKVHVDHKAGLLADLDIDGTQQGGRSRVEAHGTVKANAEMPALTVKGEARIGGPLAAAKTASLDWSLELALPETPIAALPAKTEGIDGTVQLALKAHGTRRDAFADLTLAARQVQKQKSPLEPVDADLAVHVTEVGTTASLDTRLGESSLLTAQAKLDLPGRGLFAALAHAPDPNADVTVQMPRRSIASLLAGAPIPGTLGGEAHLTGRVRDPKLAAAFDLRDLTALDGQPTHATLALDGSLAQITAKAQLADALTVTVVAPPRAFLAAKKSQDGAPVELQATIHAPKTPVDRLLPKTDELAAYRGSQGTLSADLEATITLQVGADKRALEGLDLRGPLLVQGGKLTIPGTSRVIHDIGLSLIGQGESLRLEKLEAHESDLEKPDRRLTASGSISVRAKHADLDLDLRDVLLFGGTFGQADAPRASLSGAIQLKADLARPEDPITHLDVTVQELDLESPDRFLRAHQQEVLTLGDLAELGAGLEVGKLRRQKPVTPAPKRGDKTLDVLVHVPRPVHVKQRPLELWARGEVHVERFGEVRETTGTLTVERGNLLVGGLVHTLHHGEVRMTPEGPYLDLHFQRTPAPAALRDFATANQTVLQAHMQGVLGKQKLTVSGMADSLMDTLAINNGGRARVLTSPEAPASQTAQLPTTREIRLTAYMGANLPHLAILTRMNTYADPSIHRFSYGRFQNLEAERYTENGKWRLKTTSRAPVIGQSEGEVEYSRLFLNTPRVVSGVGLLGGTRVGGGPAVFWEWSSAE